MVFDAEFLYPRTMGRRDQESRLGGLLTKIIVVPSRPFLNGDTWICPPFLKDSIRPILPKPGIQLESLFLNPATPPESLQYRSTGIRLDLQVSISLKIS